jgi:hypothetical protein
LQRVDEGLVTPARLARVAVGAACTYTSKPPAEPRPWMGGGLKMRPMPSGSFMPSAHECCRPDHRLVVTVR